jgi:hypothetical protein
MSNSSLEAIDKKLILFLQEMITHFDSGINAGWDFELENMTLGGALTLRCELEMIASQCKLKSINFNYVNSSLEPGSEKLLKNVLDASRFAFNISNSTSVEFAYPRALMNYLQDFSYFSSSRVTALHSLFHRKPLLNWNTSVDTCLDIQNSLNLREFAVLHLKNVGSYETSKANMSKWVSLISEISKTTSLPLLLIGDDDYPKELMSINGVLHLNSISIPLMSQLALTSNANFFIGSASGIASSAIFSDTPYLIFKDPKHHQLEMARELGDSNCFPWAGSNQFIFREKPSRERIENFIRGLSYDAEK